MKSLSQSTLDAFKKLKEYLSTLESVAVAYSGGVDSSLLLYAATMIPDLTLVAYTVKSAMLTECEIESAVEIAEKMNVDHRILEVDIFSFSEITENSPERCYHCKTIILQKIISSASSSGIRTILDGTHSEDLFDYRPGLKAIHELGVISPLKESGFDKNKISELSAYLELPSAGKESYPCLATRIPYGTVLTDDLLRKTEYAEKIIKSFGFRQIRARIHGDILRIEVAANMLTVLTSSPVRQKMYNALLELGFEYITVDLQGYRTGSMNVKLLENR